MKRATLVNALQAATPLKPEAAVQPLPRISITTDFRLLSEPAAAVASVRFWYRGAIGEVLDASPNNILRQLAFNCHFALIPTQRDAWLAQIEFLRPQLNDLSGSIFFEFNVPRMGRQIDVVVV